ncbi:hypothetical protein [Ruegeria sp. HKCCD8929]|uniref:hypothetical protein n=1 Tax=Ruegeria sp. HKCCD8929 TaxID=2683006 RepID=UPI0020C3D368|nr:hypothetical protein [Ruegeria sp. HKCCD8929]
MSDTSMTDAQQKEWDLKLRKIDAEIANLYALTTKTTSEVGQIKMNTFLAPFLAAAGLMGATAAIVKMFF